MILPNDWTRMCLMAARLFGDRHQHKSTVFHAFDLALQDAELRRVYEVVRGVDREKRRTDRLQLWRGIVVARRVVPVRGVVRIRGRKLRLQLSLDVLVCGS